MFQSEISMICELSSACVRSVRVFLFMLSAFLSHPVGGLLQPVAGQLPKGGNPASSSAFLRTALERALSQRLTPSADGRMLYFPPESVPTLIPSSLPSPNQIHPAPMPSVANQRD